MAWCVFNKRSEHTCSLLLAGVFLVLSTPVCAQISPEFLGMEATKRVAIQPPPWWSYPWPAVSFGSMRLWDAGVAWAMINPSEGSYNWTLLDKWLGDAQKFNVQDVMYTFGMTPRWASANPNDQTCLSHWPAGECDPPKDLNRDGSGSDQIWKDWISAIATHAAGRIKYWEIWNEPKNAFYWNGTVAQLVRMAKDARSVILSIDPDAVLLTPSAHGRFQAQYYAAGGAKYADVVTYHGYVYKSGCIGFPKASDELTRVSQVRSVMARYGQAHKPLWDTEVSWGLTSASCFYDHDLQAAFTAQILMLHGSLGVQRVFWYQYDNQEHGTLWRPDPNPHHRNYPGTLMKPGVAYQQVYNWMVGATMSAPCTTENNVWTCNFVRSGGYQAEALWDTAQTCHKGKCGTIQYPIGSQYVDYLTLDGKKHTITGGQVPIGAKPILVQNQ